MDDLVMRLREIVEAGEADERADAFDAMTTGERVDLAPTYVEISLADARALLARADASAALLKEAVEFIAGIARARYPIPASTSGGARALLARITAHTEEPKG